MIFEPLPRLESILRHVPLVDDRRVLNVGCGAFPSAVTLRRVRPQWVLYGIDLDRKALLQARISDPLLRLVQGDVRDLPGVLHMRFGLVMVRHPDLFRHPQTWEAVIPRLPAMLAPGGTLLITVYSPHEAAILAGFDLPSPLVLAEDALGVVDLAGRDRYVSVFSASPTR